ncbi:hypothetical protein CCH79_00008641 [Gambusia affinis]|uniref:Choline/carnitine acyltransferase domain-containing protein n=1 Tax=Gambusia affinis TaxID=33528 RepID=A0A315UTW8_GAMAF|nr:hypothetical protein CCH79_00008641 [Gambusia affinis]
MRAAVCLHGGEVSPRQEPCFYSTVPPQPVPPLTQTLQGYLRALEPLLPPEELNHTRRMVQEFGRFGGLGQQLQEGLERRARLTKNWVSDMWVQWAYLESRQPLAVHSNPAISLPRRDYNDWRSQLLSAHLVVPDHGDVGRRASGVAVVSDVVVFGSGNPAGGEEERIIIKWQPNTRRRQMDKLNQESVQIIETGLFSLCLDSPVMRISDEKYASRKAAQILHGGGTYSNSGNRWFDKTLQFVVGEDGSWGLLYEQATAEGPPIATLLHHIQEYWGSFLWALERGEDMRQMSSGLGIEPAMAASRTEGLQTEKPDPKRAPLVPLPMPKKLYFHIDRDIKRDIEQAKQNLDILINDLDVHVFNFKRFGKELPKKHNLSPNSFIQVALQLSYYRVHSEVCPACDIASQRMFRGGRTEYIRSPTNQALKFILAFDDRTVTVRKALTLHVSPQREAKLELLREAVDAYSELTAQALRGHGIDRHLLGLKLQAIEEGLSIPKIFMDTAYGLATHWKLRTGQVPTNTDSVMCFGPLVPDGYAICYNPQADHVHFAVTAFNCCEETNAETMARTLKETLCDLQELLQPTVHD